MNLKKKLPVLLIFSFLSVLYSFANATDIIFVSADSLQKGDIRLDQPWRYHPGDDSTWAAADFDDSGWELLDPQMPIEQMDSINWTGIGWFRKTIRIDSSLKNKAIGFRIEQIAASEIYLNGKVVAKLGRISTDPDSEEVQQTRISIPMTLELADDTLYTIAIRYSNYKAAIDPEWFNKWLGRAGFNFILANLNTVIKQSVLNEISTYSVNIGISGIFLSLAILYLFLFIFYSRKQENLYYFLFTLFIAMIFCCQMVSRSLSTNLTWIIIWSILSGMALVLTLWSYLGFLYTIFYKKIVKMFWISLAYSLITIIMLFLYIPEKIIELNLYTYIILAALESLRIIFIAIRKKKESAWIIGSGVMVFVVFILMLFAIGSTLIKVNTLIVFILFIMGLFCIPISMSIYLARDIASTNIDLIKQLDTVKELSRKELEHQKQNAELTLKSEQEKAAAREAILRAETAEAQSRAMQAEHERKTKELEEARQLQLSLLPKELPKLPYLDIAVYMKTATEVGGDYYDFHVGKDGTLTIVVGDATGHGMKAGTVVTASKSLFNAHAENPDILYTFKEMTRCLKQMDLRLLSMCMALMKINKNKMQISSAGMPPILLYRKETGIVEEYLIKGMPLGAFTEYDYQLKETNINPGDTILLMSDGLPELFNARKEMFGYERIQEIFKNSAHLSVKEIISNLETAGVKWMDNADPQDDITFVAIKMKN
ncbi:MAG: SpoIIE family protein phosphatase [Calditrichaceae bacterium]|nr:SpoIIE family protein phosphatase [Calditrichaceae bacterium]MBN2709909.1 SpoIIE family protein phosphatase [Calditrichaceae bacterium]RQV92663.1 MAG: hypothetical protein EH224_14880 [Calditrichota bacterium]